MSTGMVICSACLREVHQWGDRAARNGWLHCEDRSTMCDGGTATYPGPTDRVRGAYCCADGPLPTKHEVW